MDRLKSISIAFVMLACLTTGFTQTTFKEVDSTSYKMYISKNWSKLATYGEQAVANDFDYFYLNLRTGIAFFNLKDYKKSKLFLEKANANNSYNKTTKEYLFWSNYHLFKEKEAKEWYAQLDDTTRQRINYQPAKLINSIYVGAGQKFSNNRDVANTVNYTTVALQHHISGRINLTQSYSFSSQKLIWGNFTQHQYYINPSYLINRKLKFNIAMHGAQYKSNLDYFWSGSDQWSVETVTRTSTPNPLPFFPPIITTTTTVNDTTKSGEYKVKGTYQENDLLIQPRITKEWDKFTVAPYFSYYYSDKRPAYTEHITDTVIAKETVNDSLIYETTTINDSDSTPSNLKKEQYSYGVTVFFTHNFLTIGTDIKYISTSDKNYFFFSPFVKVNINEKLSISAYYFNKKSYTISLFEASQLINSFDEIQKFSLTTRYSISKKATLYFTYQNENIVDRVTTLEYQLNSLYLGINFKF